MTSGPPLDAVLPLDDEPTAAPFARSYTIAVLDRWLGGGTGHADVVDAAALITTELVTNALRHSTPDALRLQLRDASVLITVTDTNTHLPVLRTPSPGDVGGRGLELVTAFATRFGCRCFTGHKAVWAELNLRPDSTAACGR
ncbi:ATP-binding protein [Streptomyces sp. NPDC017941]|uniref:ATP-binding protein n=1 Tax=Streptomyces sp. NPDC017941 TaxID=3365018 RepID=UPI0037924A93